MKTTRREFLHHTALAAGALWITPALARAAGTPAGPAAPAAPALKASDLVPLGKTGLKVSRLCLGTGMRGGGRASDHTRMGQKRFTELARGALERGITFFDLADMYGTHPFFAEAMTGVPREKYSIVTKIWRHQGGIPESERPDSDKVVARFLKELKTDHLDLVLLHCLTSANWPEEMRTQMDLLTDLKKRGVIKAVGVSCHSLPALQAAAREPWVDSIHARINPYGAVMDARPVTVVPVLKEARANGKAVVGMKLIGEGQFRHDAAKKKESIRFALRGGAVDVLLVGCETLAELDEIQDMIATAPA